MIETKALSFHYPDGTQALADVSLEVRRGEFLALMGANGCGKTTLLKHFIRLLRPSSGQVFLEGKELRHFEDKEIFRRIGMVFQNPDDQLFAATVEQDVAFGAANLGLKEDEVARRTAEALKLVGIDQLADKAIHTLSFGQKRRAAIAGVLAMMPEIILLDEPTSGLDPRGTSAIMRLLRQLNRERRISMVMATHDVELVPLFCDRVAIMSHGRIVAEATPERIFANTAMVREAQLRLPRIGHLAEILRKKDGLDLPGSPMTIGQARRELRKLLGNGPKSEAGRYCYVDGEEG
ncbi:MAG: ATP-binding cassette domain-containing protein [Chloroflexota bacterium]|nr:ATP-binding cassette domain-containing protein [Chloroflexota bacterium]